MDRAVTPERITAGELAVWASGPDDAPVVLAVHGITANHVAWHAVRRQLPHLRILTPDLRGRAASRDLGGPYGIRQHAADVAALLDALGTGPVVAAGHSMGGFVVAALAAERPDLVRGLLLVDGGLPLERPAGVTNVRLPEVVLGPAMARLAMEFERPEAYHAFWREHPAFEGAWNDDVRAYADHDLVGSPPSLRLSTVPDAVRADTADLYGSRWYLDALGRIGQPTTMLRAPRGLLDEPGGLYPAERLELLRPLLPHARYTDVPDVNHYTILMIEPGAGIVAGAIQNTTEGAP